MTAAIQAALVGLLVSSAACALEVNSPAGSPVEATALNGEALHRPELPDAIRQDFELKLAQARADYERESSADHLVWLGRRTAYLGRYGESIELFSEGVAAYPDDPRFLRHRGHRYITTRQFDRAVADLTAAAKLIQGEADQVEPDGLPNARGIPTSTLHTNIYYHLGLAHYLLGDFERSLGAFERCLAASDNPDMEAASRYWLYLNQMRLGRTDDAKANLAAVDPQWDIIENDGYHRLLLLFRGDLDVDAVMPEGDDALQNATVGYGIASWHRFEGREAESEDVLDQVLTSPQWAAFGYIAAEADRF